MLAPPSTNAPDVWVQTLHGNCYVDLLNPQPEQINFRSIALALPRIPRFAGHTDGAHAYTVAQHSVEGAWALYHEHETGMPKPQARANAAAFLLHDAHEAFIGDIPTPVQHAIATTAGKLLGQDGAAAVREAVRQLKERLDEAIYTAAGLQWPLPPATADAVAHMDTRMLKTERDALLGLPPFPWHASIEGVEIVETADPSAWPADVAYSRLRRSLGHFFSPLRAQFS